jgi:hypothetical protein
MRNRLGFVFNKNIFERHQPNDVEEKLKPVPKLLASVGSGADAPTIDRLIAATVRRF